MNRNKKITVVLAFGLVVLVLTTAWGALTEAVWPPEPYQEYSRAGSWTFASPDHPVFVFGSRDPEGVSSVMVVGVTLDPTFGGAFPEATDTTPACGTAVRIGPNTDQIKVVRYATKAGTPRPTIQGIVVVEETTMLTGPDEMEFLDVTASLYSAAADQDGDGLPDEGEVPLRVVSLTASGYAKRI